MISIKNKQYDNIKAILFDKDGTLVEIIQLHKPLMIRRANRIAKLSGKDVANTVLRFWGIDIPEDKIDIRGPFMTASKSEEKIVATSALYMSGIDWQIASSIVNEAYDVDESQSNELSWNIGRIGAIEVVEAAHSKGYILGVATGDTTLRAEEACAVLNISEKMSAILGVDKVDNDKPAPDLVHLFSSLCRVQLDQIMVIGDSIKDMKMAKSAGAGLAVAIISGVTDKNEFDGYADVVIESFKEIKI